MLLNLAGTSWALLGCLMFNYAAILRRAVTGRRLPSLLLVGAVVRTVGVGRAHLIFPVLLLLGVGEVLLAGSLTTFVLANVLEEVALHFLKSAYDRARPPDPLVHTSGASFPSGHAGVTAVIAASLVICLFRPGRSRRRWELAAIALTLVMGASRAYLAAHWLSDAVGGVLIGSSIALGTAVVVQTVHDWLRRRAERGVEPPSRVEEAVEVAAEEEPGPLEASAVDHDGRAADQPADRPGPGG